ncbi:MAG: SusC/RagA family TonB-linked outer membrane protein, partial [Bacteroidota bacterium]
MHLALVASAVFLTTNLTAQISGTITDAENGEPLIGASILVQGTNTGTVTDFDGKYTLDAKAGDVLEVSYTGYSPQTITVGESSTLDIAMQQGVLIDEVVVTGYSSQRERDITGAVAVVRADELNEVTATSFSQKLEGKVTGVTINNSGNPGSGTTVRIRGISSFTNSDPLYIIDGVPTTDAFQNGINPNDIESIQVLKDASAASIYGARANNGVIIITTKQGKKGKTKITYDATIGSQTPVGKYDLIVDPAQYSEVVWRSFENSGQGSIPAEVPYSFGRGQIPEYIYAGDYTGYPGSNPVNESNYNYPDNLIMRANQSGTDWWDEVFDPALIMEHTLGVTGGGENSTFAMSFGYLDQNGTMLHTDFDRFSVRANSSFNKGRWTIGENFTFSRSTGIGIVGGNQSEQNTMTQILKAQSIIPVYDISGVNFAGGKANGLSNGSNPVAVQTRNKDNRGIFYKALGNAYVGFEVIDGLQLRSSIGMEYFDNFTNGFSFPTFEEVIKVFHTDTGAQLQAIN